MPAFLRVELKAAGPTSFGLLIPPGMHTLVIVRPRSLPWDLLPARWGGDSAASPTLCTFARDEAAGVARRFVPLLEDLVRQGINPVETLGDPLGAFFQAWLRTSEFFWLACRRTPGQSYEPLVLGSLDEACAVAERLQTIFCPALDAGQPYYFNTQNLK